MKQTVRKLGDVLTFQRGHDITKKEQAPGPYPVISSGGVSSTHIEHRYEGPGVVIGRKGSLGGVYFSEGPYWPHDTTLWIRDFKGNDPKYVYYFLQTLQLERFDAGASNPTLNRNHLHLLEVAILPPERQRFVGERLSALDDLIETNRRRIEILEEMARLLYREWFVHFRFPGHEDVDLVDSVLGPIPEGWSPGELRDVAEVNPEAIRKSDEIGVIKYLDISSVGQRTVSRPEEVDFADAPGRARRRVRDGDVLWSTVRPNRRSHVMVQDPPPNLICSTGFAVVRGIKWPPSMIIELCSTESFVAHLESLATGAAYPAVRPPDFENYAFPMPPLDLVRLFDAAVRPMHELVSVLRRQSEVLAEAQVLLLPRLVSGELDVADLDLEGVLS